MGRRKPKKYVKEKSDGEYDSNNSNEYEEEFTEE